MKSYRRLVLSGAVLPAALGLALAAATPQVLAAGAANPCAAQTNPCAPKSNPCAAKANPCAAKQPASANPCAAKANPCAAK